MMRLGNRSLLIAAAGLMLALPVGLAAGEEAAVPDTGRVVTPMPPHAAVQGVPCGKRTDVVKMLRDNFGEAPIGHGVANTGAMAEVFLSSKGTWTIVATSPGGVSCMVGAGQSWQPVVARDDTI